MLPSSTKIGIWLERSGHDFKPLQVRHRLKTRPYSNLTSSAKNNFTTEPIPIFVPDWMGCIDLGWINFVSSMY